MSMDYNSSLNSFWCRLLFLEVTCWQLCRYCSWFLYMYRDTYKHVYIHISFSEIINISLEYFPCHWDIFQSDKYRTVVLNQGWFCPRGHWAMSGDILGCYVTWGQEVLLASIGWKARILLNIRLYPRQPPPQRIMQPKMSITQPKCWGWKILIESYTSHSLITLNIPFIISYLVSHC